jgi:DnaJ domain
MLGEIISGTFSFAPSGAPLVALLATPPILFAVYIHCRLAARHLQPDLTLRTLESIEVRRSVMLYEMVRRRVKEGCGEHRQRGRTWWRNAGRGAFRQQFREELADLESYARDLRSTIIRLRSRPFKRYKLWAHFVSAQFAFSRSLGFYALTLALLIASFCYFEPILWAPGIDVGFKALVLWHAVKGRLLFANWIAADCVAVAIPIFYLLRRVQLNRKHRPAIRGLKAFAATDPDHLIHDEQNNEKPSEGPREESLDVIEQSRWFAILGVLPSATIEEAKQAYKILIKKNHPDRVHDMSPAFVTLAESETKKLNAAYAEALLHFQQTVT